MRTPVLVLALLYGSIGCGKKNADEPLGAGPAPSPAAAQPPPAEPAPPEAGRPIVLTEGFQTPESVVHDPEQDVYFVSNIHGSPLGVDDNGYVSKIVAETHVITAKFIDGANPDVTLNAPKGLAIAGDTLFVADIDTVRKFDRKTAAPQGDIRIDGATFLNGLAAEADGTIYVTDSGMNIDEQGNFGPSGTDAVYRITSDGKIEKIASGDALHRPNGLALAARDLWVASYGSAEVYRVANGGKVDVQTLPKASIDGLIHLPDGTLLASSWDAKALFRGSPGAPFVAVLEDLEAPADIGWDAKRNLVLVPLFTTNEVALVPLPPLPLQ